VVSGTPEAGGARRDAPPLPASWFRRLAWIPVALVLAAAVLAPLAGPGRAWESAEVATILNVLFCAAGPLLIALLAGWSYLRSGSAAVLSLCCGSLVFAGAFLVASLLMAANLEAAVTVHNVGVLLAGACFLAGAALALTPAAGAAEPRTARRRLALALAGALGALGAVVWGALAHVAPDFYVTGRGMTAVRQCVLGLAVAAYLVAALCFGALHRRTRSPFLFWYGLGLGLIGLGLATLVAEGAPGTALSWIGRSAQYLGALYLLGAVLGVVRSTGAWSLPEELAARRSVKELNALFELSPVGMAHADAATGRFVKVNRRFCEITGHDREELLTLSAADITHPDDRERDRELIARALRRETPGWTSRKRYRRKDGAVVWVQVTGTVFFDADGRARHTASLVEDVTAAVEAEAARGRLLREFRRIAVELEAVFATMPYLVSVHDRDGRYVRANPALVRLFGVDPVAATREEIARRVRAHFPDGRPLTPETMPSSRALRGETVGEVEYLVTDAQGEERALVVNAVPLMIDGEVDGAVLVQRDVTDRHRAERTIRHLASFPEDNPNPVVELDADGAVTYRNPASRAVLAAAGLPDDGRAFVPEGLEGFFDALRRGEGTVDLVREVAIGDRAFRETIHAVPGVAAVRIYATDFTAQRDAERERTRLLDDLARSNRDLEQFASVASHDLHEPLRAVIGYANLLQERGRGVLDEKLASYVQGAVDGAVRMERMIDDLLAFSRVDSRGGERRPADAAAAVSNAIANLGAAIAESGAAVSCGTLPRVLADAGQLTQLFQNLIGNAVKFHGDAAPRIDITAVREGARWRFVVRDNGIGVDPRQRERIFEIFQRLHPRTRYPGTGMGLAICKRIVERHGGTIWVESAPGGGSAFCFTLPDGGDAPT
jgi:PAS domain S-box-containing protein